MKLPPRMRAWLNRWLGNRGEQAAEKYLRALGWKILSRGARVRHGEIDIIALEGRTLVFVEVKTRRRGYPKESITLEKQRRLTRAVLRFSKRHGLLDQRGRFDVIAITWPELDQPPHIEHIRNAFAATD